MADIDEHGVGLLNTETWAMRASFLFSHSL